MKESQTPEINFIVVQKPWKAPHSGNLLGVLVFDNWNDYNYYTSYQLTIFDDEGKLHKIGGIRIASAQMGEKKTVVLPGTTFKILSEEYFSLGHSLDYYASLNGLKKTIRDSLLKSLRDMAYDSGIWHLFKNEDVTLKSLLRGTSEATVLNQYRRIALGGALLTKFNFTFDVPTNSPETGYQMKFEIDPEKQMPPTNVHAIIGRNGCGKTFALRFIAEKLIEDGERFLWSEEAREDAISSLTHISFSPFDKLHKELFPGSHTIPFPVTRVSLHDIADKHEVHVKTPDELAHEFIKGVQECAAQDKYERWQHVVRLLNTDPGFADYAVAEMTAIGDRGIQKEALMSIFDQMSSGHKIVLLSITQLIQSTAEKSLVLIDEPETHLHPPLLSSFIRAVSDVMLDRNGVAIIATHSPVVLQEVPSACVWKLDKFGDIIVANRPEIETFGENVGTLTREVFGYEVMKSGFFRLIEEVVSKSDNVDEVFKIFNSQLGGEAQAIIRGLMARKNKKYID